MFIVENRVPLFKYEEIENEMMIKCVRGCCRTECATAASRLKEPEITPFQSKNAGKQSDI